MSDYWETVRTYYQPFDTAPKTGSAEVYLHEMPGGQYTNLKEQAASMDIAHRWPEIARTYAEVNQLFGDIVKVTPSSKVVGDMTMFLITRGIQAADVVNLPEGTAFPESVIDMLAGNLGQPLGGWPKQLQRVVLGKKKPLRGRPGASAKPVQLEKVRAELAAKLRREANDDDLFSYLMYPQVFLDFAKFQKDFGDVSVLPTPAFFYGLAPKEEVHIDLEEGKTLFISLANVSEPDEEGRRLVSFELNGLPRGTTVADKKMAPKTKPREKADPADPCEIGAPIPGMVTALAVNVGTKVASGDKLVTLEAMKMLTTLTAPIDGVVESIHAKVGETVESKDLVLRLRT
jgi:pyruvate carboxylase